MRTSIALATVFGPLCTRLSVSIPSTPCERFISNESKAFFNLLNKALFLVASKEVTKPFSALVKISKINLLPEAFNLAAKPSTSKFGS